MKVKYPYLQLSEHHDRHQQFINSVSDVCNINQSPSSLYDSFNDNMNLDTTKKFEVFHFTLASSIDDFWNAKAYALALVIAAFSGAWPYIKLVLLEVVWLCPLSPKLRKRLLLIDQAGKYSFVDLYVCIFMLVSFYMTITEEVGIYSIMLTVATYK